MPLADDEWLDPLVEEVLLDADEPKRPEGLDASESLESDEVVPATDELDPVNALNGGNEPGVDELDAGNEPGVDEDTIAGNEPEYGDADVATKGCAATGNGEIPAEKELELELELEPELEEDLDSGLRLKLETELGEDLDSGFKEEHKRWKLSKSGRRFGRSRCFGMNGELNADPTCFIGWPCNEDALEGNFNVNGPE
jgi:hypothetical protein